MKRLLLVLPFILLGVTAAHFAQSDAVFHPKCHFVGWNKDDAIVSPGQVGAAHRHDYFGTMANAFTTTESLMSDTGQCFLQDASFAFEPADHAAYWAPAIIYKRKPIVMSDAVVDAYYFLGKHHPPVQPFPLGLKIIAGDAHATSPQPSNVVRMRCVDNHGGQSPNQASIPDCRSGPYNTVVVVVLFPECWDGERLDSWNHKAHMAYATNEGCPASHPVKVPKLSMTIRYLGNWHGGPGSTFSSGGVYSAHADFWNAWIPERQAELVDVCLNAVVNCKTIHT